MFVIIRPFRIKLHTMAPTSENPVLNSLQPPSSSHIPSNSKLSHHLISYYISITPDTVLLNNSQSQNSACWTGVIQWDIYYSIHESGSLTQLLRKPLSYKIRTNYAPPLTFFTMSLLLECDAFGSVDRQQIGNSICEDSTASTSAQKSVPPKCQ